MTVLTPDRDDALHAFISFARASQSRFKLLGIGGYGRYDDVDFGGAQRLLPVFRAALPNVPQFFGACRHPLSTLPAKAVEGFLWNAERLEPLICQRNADPCIRQWTGRIRRRSHNLRDVLHQLLACFPIINAKYDVGGHIGSWTRSQDTALDIVEFKLRVYFCYGHLHPF